MNNERKIIGRARQYEELKPFVTKYNELKELKKPTKKVVGQIKDRLIKIMNKTKLIINK